MTLGDNRSEVPRVRTVVTFETNCRMLAVGIAQPAGTDSRRRRVRHRPEWLAALHLHPHLRLLLDRGGVNGNWECQ